MGFFVTFKGVNISYLFYFEGATELENCEEMSSSMLIPLTNTHAVRGRPTLKDVEGFQNESVRELSDKGTKLKRHSMISNERNDVTECQETAEIVEKSLSTGVCKHVNIVRICRAGDQCKNSDVFFESEKNNRMSVTKLCSLKGTDCQQRKMENNSFTVVPLVVTIAIFLIGLILFSKGSGLIVFLLRVILFHHSVFLDDTHIGFSGLCIISKMCLMMFTVKCLRKLCR